MRSPSDDAPISPPVLRGNQRPARSESRVLAMRSRFERMTEAEEIMAEMEEITKMQNKARQEEETMEEQKKEDHQDHKSKRHSGKRPSRIVTVVLQDESSSSNSSDDNDSSNNNVNNKDKIESEDKQQLEAIKDAESKKDHEEEEDSTSSNSDTDMEIAYAQQALAEAMGALNSQSQARRESKRLSKNEDKAIKGTENENIKIEASSPAPVNLEDAIKICRSADDFESLKEGVCRALEVIADRLSNQASASAPPAPPAAAAACGLPPPPPPPPPPPMMPAPKLNLAKRQPQVKVVITNSGSSKGPSTPNNAAGGGDLMNQLANTLNRRKNRASLASAYQKLQ